VRNNILMKPYKDFIFFFIFYLREHDSQEHQRATGTALPDSRGEAFTNTYCKRPKPRAGMVQEGLEIL